jgi:probable selenium-dependent hydroxylase accessory protein YqeC
MLKDLLGLYQGCVVSITGSGGKTSLMFALGEELRKDYKVLITTTTKIFIPPREKYDFMYLLKNRDRDYGCRVDNSIYIIGKDSNEDGKLIGLDCGELSRESRYFDFTLIEADGSKRKPLKGWNEYEPVIWGGTQMTIGVLDIQAVGLRVNEENIYRVERFSSITGAKIGEKVGIGHIAAMIFHSEGLFKASVGERILYINKVENDEDGENLNRLMEVIRDRNKGYITKAVSGSVFQGKGEGLEL